MPVQSIEPTTKAVDEVVKELKQGQYFLPSFQRNYVWDTEDARQLIESIRKHFPIGVIVLWRPSESFATEIPFARPLVDVPDARPAYYVIDGQQRLTSLLMLFSDWRIARGGEVIEVQPIHYEPGGDRLYKGRRYGFDLADLAMALEDPFGPRATELGQKMPKQYQTRAKEVLNRIRHYRVPLYVIETNQEDDQTISEMARAFIQLNKQGVRISNIELLLSLLAGTWRHEITHEIRQSYKAVEVRGLDLQPFLRLVLAGLGLSQSVISKPERFKAAVERLALQDIGGAVREAATGIEVALDLLREELGVPHASLLPSQVALVPLGAYLQHRGITAVADLDVAQRRLLASWFVLASFKGRYGGSVDTKLEQDLQVVANAQDGFPFDGLRQGMKPSDQQISWRDFERARRVNALRAAGRHYLFLLFALLVKNEATDWAGRMLRSISLGRLVKHHIFPRDFLRERLATEEDEEQDEELINNFANLTWIDEEKNPSIGDTSPDEYIREVVSDDSHVSLEDAERHFIPTDRRLLDVQHYEEFLEERLRQIHKFATTVFPDIVGD